MITTCAVKRTDLTINGYFAVQFDGSNKDEIEELVKAIDTTDLIVVLDHCEGFTIERTRRGAIYSSRHQVRKDDIVLVSTGGNIFIENEAEYNQKYVDMDGSMPEVYVRAFKPRFAVKASVSKV